MKTQGNGSAFPVSNILYIPGAPENIKRTYKLLLVWTTQNIADRHNRKQEITNTREAMGKEPATPSNWESISTSPEKTYTEKRFERHPKSLLACSEMALSCIRPVCEDWGEVSVFFLGTDTNAEPKKMKKETGKHGLNKGIK